MHSLAAWFVFEYEIQRHKQTRKCCTKKKKFMKFFFKAMWTIDKPYRFLRVYWLNGGLLQKLFDKYVLSEPQMVHQKTKIDSVFFSVWKVCV